MKIDFSQNSWQNLTPETDFEKKVLAFISEWFSASETVKVQTSGSTGAPKIFDIEKVKMRNSAKMTCDILGLQKGDSALLCLPVEYISGKMMVVRAIERDLILTVKSPSAAPLEDVIEQIDFCALSPLQVENSLQKLHFFQNIIIGGASVSETLKNKIHNALSSTEIENAPKIFETYGMSETLSHIALKEISPVPEAFFSVLPGVEISTDDRNCLQIFAPNLNSELLTTNDLVEIKNETGFRFLGRIDHVINSGGLKIYPEELEALVKKILPQELIFLGIPDEVLGQKLVLVIEGAEDETQKSLLRTVNFPTKNHQPKEIIFLKEFPRIPNGKIDRQKLLQIATEKIRR
ncbi:O-succinylbenzoic acid--CoA ligase [Kaistella treverensis]|uniref:O-succinylbenzoic acid--CoA ligase n=1 Tax=Kaistella treverensis TaxID=631455 RepID=A0A1I3MN98_9FLAO|nr:AMP-binding protein [Kaistella treverensis]SFI98136.1 O-succinylbenzoic acid--CoA ligase [Kaistella treverensis]